MADNVSRETATKIAAVFGIAAGNDMYGFVDHPYETRFDVAGYYGPNVWPGEHEETSADWIISWESGPQDWATEEMYSNLITAATRGEVWGEPVNSFTMALYANDAEAAHRAVNRLAEDLGVWSHKADMFDMMVENDEA